jgi:flagellar hook-length control protein FliK
VDLKDADKLALAVIASKGNVAKPNLDATSNAAISAMVASAFTNNASPSAKLDPKGFFTEVQAKPTDGPTIQQALGIVATPKGITDARGKLNITSVQCSATSIASQLDSSSSAAKVQPLVNAVIPTGKGVVSTDPKTLAIERDAISVTSTEVAQSGNQKAPSKDRKQDDSQSSNPEMQAPLQTSDVAKPAPTITEYQQTATERQAMVDNISKKIEELAAKSVRNEVRVEMHPPDLGSVVVNIRKDIAGLTATLNASNEPLRQALHESRNDLAGALSDRNVGQIKIEVRGASADNMNMGQQYSQAQQQQNQQNQQNQSKQATLPTGRIISDDKSEIDQPTQRRVSTTLLDMEI